MIGSLKDRLRDLPIIHLEDPRRARPMLAVAVQTQRPLRMGCSSVTPSSVHPHAKQSAAKV